MNQDEPQTTRLWIEKHPNEQAMVDLKAAMASEKFTLPAKTQALIQTRCETDNIFWLDFITTVYLLLLHRLSTTNEIHCLRFKGHIDEKNLTLSSPKKTLLSRIDEKTTMAMILELLSQKTKKIKDMFTDIQPRYAIILPTDKKALKAKEIDLHAFALNFVPGEKHQDKLQFIYNKNYFDKASIKYIENHLNILLLSLCHAEPNSPVVKLNLLTPEEEKNILHTWSSPYHNIFTLQSASCVQETIACHAKNTPQKIAVKHNDNSLTYEELHFASDCLATHIVSRGVNVGDPVCVFMERGIELIIVMIALFKAGAIFVPINPKNPEDRIEFQLNDTKSRFVMTNINSNLPGKFQDLAWIITPTLLNEPYEDMMLPEKNTDRPAYIIYTSGTTGTPKGVFITHEGLNNLSLWYQHYLNIHAEDVVSQFASQGFDTFFCETVPTLYVGACIAIVDDVIKLTPDLFFSWLSLNRITICDIPTAYAQFLFTLAWPGDIALRFIKFGGEAITRLPDTLFSFDLYNIYGPSECTVEATYFKLYDAKLKKYYAEPGHPASIGKPLANAYAYILDQYGMPAPMGVAGELLIGGACVSPGYYNRLDLTEKKFVHCAHHPHEQEKFYRTGDLAKWLDDGNIEFIGRSDNQVKIRGYRIELSDIENAIGSHSDVGEVLVLAKENINGDKSLVAYVVPNMDRERYLYQERCLITHDETNFIEGVTEDISKHGIAIAGISEKFTVGQKINLHLKLPGFNGTKVLMARLVWQKENRSGFAFEVDTETQDIINKSIEFYLSNHNIMELVLNASAKRSLKRALKSRLPEYMIPSTFVNLLEFPLTLNGKIDVKSLPQPDAFAKTLEKKYVAAKTPTEKQLAALWEKILNKSPISMTDNFFDLGGTSLTAAQLSVEMDQTFNIAIPANVLFELAYVPILAEYIDNRGKSYSTETNTQLAINQDKTLPAFIQPLKEYSKSLNSPKHIFLTGSGGFLGIFFLEHLLKTTSAKIYCLIRQGDFESAAKRLMSTASKFGIDNEVSLSERRIVAIPGDLSFDHFGLSKNQYQSLCEKVDLIIHCGAQVNIMASYQNMRGSNVLGTLEILKLATTSHDKPIHYISTLSSAYLKNEQGALIEDFPTLTYHDLFGGYAVSKWVSEVLLTQAKDRGLPVTLYRSGYIFGDSKSGICSTNDALLMLIKGCILLGYAPTMNERITLLPVDFVSHAISAIALTQGKHSDVYHIDHPTGIMWPDLVHWFNQQGYTITLISLREWKEKLKKINRDNPLYPFLPYYLALPDDYQSPPVATEKTKNRLEQVSLDFPRIDDALLKLYLRKLQSMGFFTIPEKQV